MRIRGEALLRWALRFLRLWFDWTKNHSNSGKTTEPVKRGKSAVRDKNFNQARVCGLNSNNEFWQKQYCSILIERAWILEFGKKNKSTTHKTGLCEFIPGEQVEEQLGSVLFSQSIGGVTEYCDNDKGKVHITFEFWKKALTLSPHSTQQHLKLFFSQSENAARRGSANSSE